MMKKPLVSVIIPVFNSEKSIFVTLNSVAGQTYDNFEVIVVNDGSTDASEDEIKRFKEENPQLKVNYQFQKNRGVSAARNTGLKLATGKYIAFLDSDDVWLAEKTAVQLQILGKNPKIELLATNRNNESFKKFLNFSFQKITKITPRMLLLKNFLITPTVIFQKELQHKVGFFDESLKYAEDYEFFLRCTLHGSCFLLNESLVNTGKGKPSFGHSGLSADIREMQKGEREVLQRARKSGILNGFQLSLFQAYFFSKFLRRWILTKLRN